MCCLGQFSLQLSNEIEEHDIKGVGIPEEIEEKTEISLLAIMDDEELRNTSLTMDAIDINDDKNTTPKEKIEALIELFKGKGYEIEVVNIPEIA